MDDSRFFSKQELFNWDGGHEVFPAGSDRYYAQLAVDEFGIAVRDNSIEELIRLGKDIDSTGEM